MDHGDGTSTVVLDNSVLYAEGGGQPWDLGSVGNIPVLQVTKFEDAEHPTAVSVKLGGVLEGGVEEVECVVDWPRRYDFMQQHTAQVCMR